MTSERPDRSSDSEPSHKKWRILDIGPVWISAIAALIVALTGAGLFVGGRASAPDHPAPPTGTSTSVAPTSAPPSTSTQSTTTGSNGGSAPAVFNSGSYDVNVGNGIRVHPQGSWGPGNTLGDDDIVTSSAAISPGNGSAFSFVGAQQPSYQECRARSDYSGALPWAQVPSGSYLCIKIAGNRVGQVRVDYKPDKSGNLTDVDLSGVIYEPTS